METATLKIQLKFQTIPEHTLSESSAGFTPLTDNEWETVCKMNQRHLENCYIRDGAHTAREGIKVAYATDYDFTVCAVLVDGLLHLGVSKRMTYRGGKGADKVNPELGRLLALRRACFAPGILFPTAISGSTSEGSGE